MAIQLDERQRRSLETEAIARITWGDAAGDVRAWLLSQQVSEFEADTLLHACLRRRAGEMRARGLRDLFWGLPAVAAGIILAIGGMLALDWLAKANARLPGQAYGLIFAPAVISGAYGCWRSFRGCERLAFGSHADGAVSDVE